MTSNRKTQSSSSNYFNNNNEIHNNHSIITICLCLNVNQIQEFRTGATRQNMETIHSKEECKRLRTQLTDLRDKFNDLEARVSIQCLVVAVVTTRAMIGGTFVELFS